jgi:hypothetical protein
MTKKISLTIGLFISFFSLGVYSQDTFVYLKNINYRKIEIYNNYNSKIGDIVLSGNIIKDAKISPNGKYISLIEQQNTKNGEILNSFKIYTIDGLLIHMLSEDVKKYEWSNNSSMIAILTGRYHEGGVGFSPDKLFIYNFQNTTKDNIIGLNSYPYRIAWRPNDSILYIQAFSNGSDEIFEYNILNKTLNISINSGLYFSPDCKYYYREYDPETGVKFAVYDAKTNLAIELNVNLNEYLINFGIENQTEIIGWAKEKNHVILYNHVIEDFEHKDHFEYIKKPNGKIQKQLVSREYSNRKIKEIKYIYYDVEANTIMREFATNGAERNLIVTENNLIYQKDDKFELYK